MKKEILIQIQVMAIILLIAFSEFAPVSVNISLIVRVVAFIWTILNGMYFVFLDIKNKKYISSNSIIIFASITLYFIGYFSSSIILTCGNIIINCQFIYINNIMESKQQEYIGSLKGKVKVFINGKITEKEAYEVKKGSIFLVEDNEKILVDGEVFHGSSTIKDYFSGKISKAHKGNKVYAGGINIGKPLQIEATCDGNQSFLSRVISRYQVADSYGSDEKRKISKYIQYVLVGIIIIAVIMMGIPLILNDVSVKELGIFVAIILAISTVDKIFEINHIGLKNLLFSLYKTQIYSKSMDYILKSAHVSLIGLEKSDDFIKERYDVVKIHNETMVTKEELLVYSAHCEYKSNHIIGKGIKEAFFQLAKYKGVKKENPLREDFVTKFEELHGMGVSARIKGRFVCVGNKKLMRLLNITNIQEPNDDFTHIHVAIDGKYAGYISLRYRQTNYINDFKPEMKSADIRKFGAFDVKDEINFENINSGKGKKEKFAWILGKAKIYKERPKGDIIYVLEDEPNKNNLSFSEIFFKSDKIKTVTNFIKDMKKYFNNVFSLSIFIILAKIILYSLAIFKVLGISLIFAVDSMLMIGYLFMVDLKVNKIFTKKYTDGVDKVK